jgi:hypothetical protein
MRPTSPEDVSSEQDRAGDRAWVRVALGQSGIRVTDAEVGPIADIYAEYERYISIVDGLDMASMQPPAPMLDLSR